MGDLDLEQTGLLLGNIINKHKNTLKSMPRGQKSRVQTRSQMARAGHALYSQGWTVLYDDHQISLVFP